MKIKLSKPTLIITIGAPGSGKTTFCQHLPSQICDLVYIEKDAITNAFLCQSREQDTGENQWKLSDPKLSITDPIYYTHLRDQIYRSMLEIGLVNLKMGNNVLLESSYIKEIMHGYIDNIVQPMIEDYQLKLLFFYADEATIKQRLIDRNAERDTKKLSSDQAWNDWLIREPIIPKELQKYECLIIDTTKSTEENMPKALEYLVK